MATPALTWANPAPIPCGSPLTSNQLNATANVSGSFTCEPADGAVLHVGANTLSVAFMPVDTNDYSSVTDTMSLAVTGLAPPTIQAAKVSGSLFTFTWSALPTQIYQVQTSVNIEENVDCI